jgi:hypothetical protein
MPKKEYFALMARLCFGLFFPSGGTFLFASLSSEEDRAQILKLLSPGIDFTESIPRYLAGRYVKKGYLTCPPELVFLNF